MSAAIKIEGLRKSFAVQRSWAAVLGRTEQKVVLDEVDLEVRFGEIFGLLGPNGAGKTTLIKIMSGLLLPDAGRVTVSGYDVVHQGLMIRRSIGMVYGDERSFYWRLSLLENLRFYATLYGMRPRVARQRIEELLTVLGLKEKADARMYSLSSGMKQRAAIARGLIHDPPIILMDEPTRSLDPVAAEELHALIRARVNEGRTVLLATNQMSEAETLCQRLTFINRGRNVLTGRLEDFREQFQELDYRLLVSGESPAAMHALGAFPGVLAASVEQTNGLSRIELTVNRHSMALALVIRHLVERGFEIRSCTREEPGLDEIFRKIARGRWKQPAEARQA